MARVPKLLDVSVPLVAGMPAYPGNPDFELQPVKRIADGGSSNVSRLILGTHTGTHVDAPRQFIDDGSTVDARHLVDQGVKVIGVDYLSAEQYKNAGAGAHWALLSQGAVIIEGLNLSGAEPGMYEMYCLPLRVAGGDGGPARVILER
jgi:arylformamidase